MNNAFKRWLRSGAFAGIAIVAGVLATVLAAGSAFGVRNAARDAGDDTPTFAVAATPLQADKQATEELLQQDLAFITRRMAGDTLLDMETIAKLRADSAKATRKLKKENIPSGPSTFTGPWGQIGPNPIVQGVRTPGAQRWGAMSGRIGALAIRPSNGQLILGAAQGGIWLYNAATGQWSPKSDDSGALAIGALAIAPSNDAIVYAGTGEGAFSGDSYFGNGILKSTDGGNTWNQVSGDYFAGVSTSGLVVDPTNPNHLYASIIRGRGGARRTSPTAHSQWGVWESKDGGVTWTLINPGPADTLGATDIDIDPQNGQILYASFLGDKIYKSTNGGSTWTPIMNGLPAADYAGALTRFSLGISHPAGQPAVLYTGFDWADGTGHHASRVFKSIDQGASWAITSAGTGADTVEDYCATQCSYDNVIEVDPADSNVVYAGGQFNYGIGSGGIFRSDDGGATWKNLGYDQHPDFHALAINRANPAQILMGNDGGVWTSSSRGGRTGSGTPLSAVTWQSLNGVVTPTAPAVAARSGLSIAQFTSIGIAPQVAPGPDGERFWGGTQDNGTLRKSVNNKTWFDVASGDGGQVLVDPTPDVCLLGPSCFVYGTYYGISPYRYTDGGNFFSNAAIRRGLNTAERSDFYTPFVLSPNNNNQLYLGTYRLYRTDNARTDSAGDVLWKPISGDLTTGCTGTAPNGARNCTISAIGVGGGSAVYTGSLDGLLYLATDGQTSDAPTWTKLDDKDLPARPVAAIAVDRSNYRIAYVGYNGFAAATPKESGHVYRTRDGGQSFTDISGNLPDTPVNSLILDPSFPNTLYAGTDVGPFVTYNGGTNWYALGSGFPIVGVWQLAFDSTHRLLAAGTHGRGAFRLADTTAAPALVLSKVDTGKPVGPSSNITYTITLKNVGNAPATGVSINDPVPANTSFVSADNGGTNSGGTVTWSGITIAAGGSKSVQLVVSIADALKKKVASIVNDGMTATATGGFSTSGSPFITPIAPPYAVSVAPASQTDGARVGSSAPYTLTVSNLGSNDDSYSLSATSAWSTTFFDATCTTAITSTGTIASGDSKSICVKVAVPSGTANGASNTGTITVTSTGSSAVTGSAAVTTLAVAVDTLLVDNDDNGPDVQGIYKTALDGAGLAGQYSVWDLRVDKNLPRNYVKAFKNVVWFTGNSYPGPVLPYEATLKAFLDNGGRLAMSGHDILDQAAGTTPFVHDYLHISWDGTETQNDKPTTSVTGVAGNPVSNGIGTIAIDHSVLGAGFEDRITPNGTATAAFTDNTAQTDALTYSGTYKVLFMAFPLEAYGTAAQKADLVSRTMTFFGP
jgi:uncharacterized repeat protein (TIGR01451 family)